MHFPSLVLFFMADHPNTGSAQQQESNLFGSKIFVNWRNGTFWESTAGLHLFILPIHEGLSEKPIHLYETESSYFYFIFQAFL